MYISFLLSPSIKEILYKRSINRTITVQAGQCIKARPYLKHNEIKKDWGSNSSDRAPA
jgi:hypothetical protein